MAMPAVSRPTPSAIATHTSSPVCGRDPLGSWAVGDPLVVVVALATVAGGVGVALDGGVVVVLDGGVVVVLDGGGVDVEVVLGQPRGSTYCESPAEPEQPLPDPASAAPAPSRNGTTTATRHASTSPSLLMAPVLQAR
jgi:hypothetical protein